MKKKNASKTAFLTPRVLISFSICTMAAFLALFAFARTNESVQAQKPQPQQAPSIQSTEPLTGRLAMDEDAALTVPDSISPPANPDVITATFVVNTTADTQDATPGNGICADAGGACSLRAAITESNALGGTNVITLPAGTYTLSLVAANEDLNAGGDLDIRSNVTINGATAATTIIQANAAANTATERVLHVVGVTGTTVNINNVTVRNGNATGVTSGGGISVSVLSTVNLTNVIITNNRVILANNAFGGGMIVSGIGATVTLTGCTVSNNSAIATTTAFNGFAGGIYNQQATVSIINSTVSGNIASSFHGGVRNLASTAASIVNITNSTISGNVSQGNNNTAGGGAGEGGGVANFGVGAGFASTVNITASTISGNAAQIGGVSAAGTTAGGMENISVAAGDPATINLTNSTVSGNSADDAGGVYNDGGSATTNIKYSTIAFNTGGATAGGVHQDVTAGGITNLKSSIISNNTATTGPNIDGVITSQGYNHVQSTTGGTFTTTTGDVTGTDPLLGALANNGGPTFTHLPGGSSPVVNTIPSGTNECGTTVTVDQRAFTRPQGSGCDKGSVEQGTGPTPTVGPTASPTPSPTPTPTPTATIVPPPTVCTLAEAMDDVTTLENPKGWVETNHSTVVGTTGWFQGSTAVFCAQSGACASYVGANFNADGGAATDTISNWLLTPPITLENGATLVFWTRTVDVPAFADRLQVRMSTNGTSSNVGTTPTDVGDFTTLLLDINPTYSLSGYPNFWQVFCVNISGLSLPIKGRLAFRYFVENGGPAGANSDFIGIDTVSYNCGGITCPTPAPTPTPTPTPAPTPTPIGCVVLYDQSDNSASGNGTSSQDFETANDAYDDQAADDFVVPSGQTWIIQQVFAPGAYYNGAGPAPFVNLYFYQDAAGFPGAAVAGGTFLNTPIAVDTAGTFTVTVPGAGLTLTAGTYWISVQARMDFSAGGQWAWADRSVTSNTAAAWQNPGGGFGTTACLSWGRRGATCVIDAANPDQGFALRGCLGGPTPTPPTASISGNVTGCASPAPVNMANATMTLTGGATGSTLTNASGNYTFSGLTTNLNYTVTPTKAAHIPGSAGISTVDVIADQRHFLAIGTPLTGCRLAAGDVNGVGGINTVDVIAIQRFFLGLTTGTANTGKYQFTPASTSYTPLMTNQVTNYTAILFGDVAPPFVPRPGGDPSQDAAAEGMSREVPSTVAAVVLPNVAAGQGNFTAAVGSSEINAGNKLVGFQGDFTFDERVVTFQSQPVSNAGLTGGNWNVSGNVLDGPGPIRTLRISAYSNDFKPLSGSGTLFNLNMTQVSKAAQSTPLIWAPAADQFIFIDADLNTQKAGNAAPGSVTLHPSQR